MIEAEPLGGRVAGAADILCRYPYRCWRYGDSIGYEGLIAATRLTGDRTYLGFTYGSIKSWIPRAEPYTFWDNTAPGLAMCLAYKEFGDDAIVAAAISLTDYLRARRRIRDVFAAFESTPLHTPAGGGQLSDEEQKLMNAPGAGVFVDCMHFDPPFFAHLGAISGSNGLTVEASRQACGAIEILQDRDTGLFAHFYLERTQRLYGHGWSRGQGWALLGLLDVLEHGADDLPGREQITDALRQLAEALAATQQPSGHWRGRIGDPGTSLETSAAFFFCAGIWRGVRLGVFGDELLEVAERAWHAGLTSVAPDGRIAGVSAEVWPSPAESHYRGVPIDLQVPWGQGPFLLAAAERFSVT